MSRSSLTVLILLTPLIPLTAPRLSDAQMTWHVDDDCSRVGTGSEADPFCTIQQGVDAAQDADTVLVATEVGMVATAAVANKPLTKMEIPSDCRTTSSSGFLTSRSALANRIVTVFD